VSTLVIDASAILAMIFDEAGGDMVADVCDGAVLNAVNLDEVLHKVARRGMDPILVETQLSRLGISVVAFDARQARISAALHSQLTGTDTSFADRACLSMGLMLDATVLTADAKWMGLGLDVDIRLIR
jgi:ribonuclease VapC